MWRREKKEEVEKKRSSSSSSSDFCLNGFSSSRSETTQRVQTTLPLSPYTHSCVHSWDLFFSFIFWFSADRSTRAHAGERRTESSPNRPRSLDCCCVCVYTATLLFVPYWNSFNCCPIIFSSFAVLLSTARWMFEAFCRNQKKIDFSTVGWWLPPFFLNPQFLFCRPPFNVYICYKLKILIALYIHGWSLCSVFTLLLASQFDALRWIWMDFRPGQNLKI